MDEDKLELEHHVPPGFMGSYYVEFMDGSGRLVDLTGSIRLSNGTPLYLVGSDKTFYNYNNVISVRKKVR